MLLSLFSACYLLHARPYADPFNQRLQVYNELVIYGCCFITVELKLNAKDPKMVSQLGWALIFLVLSNIVFNMYFVFRDMIKTCRKRLIAKGMEMRVWDTASRCNCKCIHCGS